MTKLDSFRSRRLEACRAAQLLHDVIENIGIESDVWDWEHNGNKNWTLPTPMMKLELQNSVANVLRLIILASDGGPLSSSKLERF